MRIPLNGVLSAQSPLRVQIIALLLAAVVGAIDFATGNELSLSIFYTIPVGVSSWYVGKHLGFAVSITCAAIWLAVDIVSGHQYSHPAIVFWNTGVRLGFFIIIAFLLDHLRRSRELLESLARNDDLTGLINARTFRQNCDWVFDLARRHGRPVTLGYIDLDGFKAVNDSLGHSAGDQILVEVATALTKQFRTTDFVGRLGGDEFAILLPETNLAGARQFFTGLRENLTALATLKRWSISYSIGVAVFSSPLSNTDNAIQRADALMYKVKNSGKNNIVFEEYTDGSLLRHAAVEQAFNTLENL